MFAVANDAQYLHDIYENSFIFVGVMVDDKLNRARGNWQITLQAYFVISWNAKKIGQKECTRFFVGVVEYVKEKFR